MTSIQSFDSLFPRGEFVVRLGRASRDRRNNGICMKAASTTHFESIREWNDEFLSLFPQRFDYIFAPYPNLGETPQWKTESRHPLSDRLIQQGAYLYGVRFAAKTNYCLLDIDTGSAYHPSRDPFAISRITAALEPLGLVRHLACTSSYSGGLHLYFPFQEAQSSWQLAIALACLLENAGFKLRPGQLEVFPNPKPYSAVRSFSLFNAHRLPLQIGSYLLDQEYQPIWSDSNSFVNRWQTTQIHNDIETKALKQILKQARRQHFGISGKAEKFLNDLNAEIELGWTGYGQTNRLLGRITMRAFIFNHIRCGGEPLSGKTLVDEIVNVARSLPGYREWCRHQHEIEHRAEEWTRCIETSHYFHYGNPDGKFKAKKKSELDRAVEQAPSWNQQQSAAARDRIRSAIADLLEEDSLPSKATARFHALLTYGIGGSSLYRHRDLWHPNYLANSEIAFTSDSEQQPASDQIPPSLFLAVGGDIPNSNASSDRSPQPEEAIAGNVPAQSANDLTFNAFDQSEYAQPALFVLKDWPEIRQEAGRNAQRRRRRIKQERLQVDRVAQIQQFLQSDDPILMAEALAWMQINSGAIVQLALPFDVLSAIAQQIQRLGWLQRQVGDRLSQQFGKQTVTDLTALELMRCLEWLTTLST